MSQTPESPSAGGPAQRGPDAHSDVMRGRPAQGAAKMRLRAPSRSILVLWCLALGVVVVDQLTKAWAVNALADSQRIDLLGSWLGFVLVRNPGAAFSFATGQTWVFTAVALVVIVIVLRVSRRLGSMWWATTLGLVLGGAVGNLIDRLTREPGLFRGHVVDFIDYGGMFVGNVADIAIVGAAAAIMALSAAGLELDGTRAGHHSASDEQPVMAEEAEKADAWASTSIATARLPTFPSPPSSPHSPRTGRRAVRSERTTAEREAGRPRANGHDDSDDSSDDGDHGESATAAGA